MKSPKLFLLSLFVLLLSSCDNDVLTDYAPYILQIKLLNSEGENLLDKSVVGNIVDSNIEMSFGKTIYPMETPDYLGNSVKSRYYMPTFRGLQRKPDFEEGYILTWGEFDCAKSKNYEFTLNIPGYYPFDFQLEIKTKGSKVKTRLTMNGKIMTGSKVYIVL